MISLILPVFEAGAFAERSWAAVRAFVRSQREPWEALFICDGCRDGSDRRLSELEAVERDPRLRVLSHQPNRGKGFALRTGLLAARGHWRIFTDIDLAYPFEDIRRVADTLMDGAAVAIAAREHPESRVALPPHLLRYAQRRRWQSKAFGQLARLLLPLAQRDTQAGLKGMSAHVADWLLPHLKCDGFSFDCELLVACRELGIDVAEVPVTVQLECVKSTTGAGSTLAMVRDLWRIRRRWKSRHIPEPARIRIPLQKAA